MLTRLSTPPCKHQAAERSIDFGENAIRMCEPAVTASYSLMRCPLTRFDLFYPSFHLSAVNVLQHWKWILSNDSCTSDNFDGLLHYTVRISKIRIHEHGNGYKIPIHFPHKPF